MNTLKNPVLLAKIGAPHGVRGELRVTSFTQDPMAIGDYGSLTSKDGRRFTVSKSRPAKNVLVVSFKEVQNRNDAEAVRGLELFIERDNFPENADDHEFYINDLIGMHIFDTQEQLVGRVHAIPNFGAGDLLEIAPSLENGRFGHNTYFLDFTKANVPDIDFDKKTITIVIPNEISERDEEPDDHQ